MYHHQFKEKNVLNSLIENYFFLNFPINLNQINRRIMYFFNCYFLYRDFVVYLNPIKFLSQIVEEYNSNNQYHLTIMHAFKINIL